MDKKYKLDAYEQDIEDNFEKHISVREKIKFIENAAKHHLKNKRSIILRTEVSDIEGAMRIDLWK